MKSSARSLDEILNELLKQKRWDNSFKLDYYRNNWKEMMKAPLNRVAKPAHIYGKKLVLEVNNDYWKNEMEEHKTIFINMINETFRQYKIENLQIK
jgi:predicted nucleic acid-binding Zn ribbon protein